MRFYSDFFGASDYEQQTLDYQCSNLFLNHSDSIDLQHFHRTNGHIIFENYKQIHCAFT